MVTFSKLYVTKIKLKLASQRTKDESKASFK